MFSDHEASCQCGKRSSAVHQTMEELDFMKSACAAAKAGNCTRLTKILDKKPEALHDDGISGLFSSFIRPFLYMFT